MDDPSSVERRADGQAARSGYIYEIQGLRTVAALLVAIYHIWFQRVSGGVDIFFVVAAFFLTGSFLRKSRIDAGSVMAYYISTFRRILPGAILVILATIVGCILFMPHSAWTSELADAVGSTLFFENWVLARSGQNYLDQGMASSAFQQMWALSLQVQFYLLFPLLILMGELASRRLRRSREAVLVAMFLLLFALSLAFSIYLTARNQPFAYFHTATRAWEFAAGSLAALLIARVRISATAARWLGLAALLLLLTFGRLIDVSAQFPGYMALVPVLTAIAIFVSASNGGRIPILSWKPLVWAGDYSFAFYLWHWPLLTFTRLILVRDEVGLVPGLAIMLVSGILAYATTRFLEIPFRRNSWLSARPRFAIASCAAAMVAGLIGVWAWNRQIKTEIAAARTDLKSYLVNPSAPRAKSASLIPAPIIVKDDIHEAYSNGCHQSLRSAEVVTCEYGRKAGKITIAVVGGSHSLQWLPVLERIAGRRDYRIVSMTKSACAFSLSDEEREMQDPRSCLAWNRAVVARIEQMRPDLVFTIATRSVHGHDGVPAGYVKAWHALETDRIRIVALRDNPWFGDDIPYCVELRGAEHAWCGLSKAAYYGQDSAVAKVVPKNMTLIDLTSSYCPDGFCSVVQNGILVYRDRHHLTKTYIYGYEHQIEKALDQALHS